MNHREMTAGKKKNKFLSVLKKHLEIKISDLLKRSERCHRLRLMT